MSGAETLLALRGRLKTPGTERQYARERVEHSCHVMPKDHVHRANAKSSAHFTVMRCGHYLTGVTLSIRVADGQEQSEDARDLVESIDVEIGGKRVWGIPGSYLAVHDMLYRTPQEREGHARLARQGIVSVPLVAETPLPLLHLSKHEVKFTVYLKAEKPVVKAWLDYKVTREPWENADVSLPIRHVEPCFVDEHGVEKDVNDYRLLFWHVTNTLVWRIRPAETAEPGARPPKLTSASLVVNGGVVRECTASYLADQHALEEFGTSLPEDTYVMHFADDNDGAIDFGPTDKPTLRLTFEGVPAGLAWQDMAKVDILAIASNELRIADGMAVLERMLT